MPELVDKKQKEVYNFPGLMNGVQKNITATLPVVQEVIPQVQQKIKKEVEKKKLVFKKSTY
jgi:hypothetical protein